MSIAPSAGGDEDVLRALIDHVDQQDPSAFNNLGVLYHARGLHAEAVEALLRALALDPRMHTAVRNLELAAAQPGACEPQLAALDARVAADPDSRAAARERARLLRLVGRRDAAIRQLDALIAEDPDDAAALFERGVIEQRAGDLRRAHRWFDRAVNAGDDGPDARLQLAEVLYQLGYNEQALACVDQLLTRYRHVAEAHLLRGFVLGDMGRHDEAIAAARLAAQLKPALSSAQVDLSIESATMTAVPVENDASPACAPMPLEPDGALARYGLGLAFRERGYFEEARGEFERSIAAGEDARLATHALGELDLIVGRCHEARVRYETLLASEEQPRLWNEHGVAMHQAGDVRAAADSYRRALRIDPRYALAYNNLGVVLDELGDHHAARESLLRAAELDPLLVVARLNLARWFANQRDPLAALSLLREIVAFHPRDAASWQVMGTVLHSLDRTVEATDALRMAIECGLSSGEARQQLARVLEQPADADGAAQDAALDISCALMHAWSRLAVAIDWQRECPEAVGTLQLLTVSEQSPRRNVVPRGEDLARQRCDEADRLAARQAHDDALERYVEARLGVDSDSVADLPPAVQQLWQRAALGEAWSLCLLGRETEALPSLKRAGAVWPQHPEVLALFAVAAASDADRQPESAAASRTAMLRLLRLDVDSATLLHIAGDAAARLRDDALALGFYRRALAHDPTRLTARVAVARVLRQRGDLLAARLELVAALSGAPTWREPQLELARVHRDAARLADARGLLAELLMRSPTDLDALQLLIEVLVAEERFDDARIAVDRVLCHDPSHTGAHWFDGVLLAQPPRTRAPSLVA